MAVDILRVKYQVPLIGQIEHGVLLMYISKILLTISVITGWRLPSDDEALAILQEHFYKKLIEDYSMINPDEIEFAFRQYSTRVKDWGKNFNLNFFDEVMNIYLQDRKDASEEEERKQIPLQIEYKPSPEKLLNDQRERIESCYQNFLSNDCRISLMPTNGVEILSNDGFCVESYYIDFFNDAERQIKINNSMKNNSMKKLRSINEHLNVDQNNIESVAKKIALIECFKHFRKAGFKNIYS